MKKEGELAEGKQTVKGQCHGGCTGLLCLLTSKRVVLWVQSNPMLAGPPTLPTSWGGVGGTVLAFVLVHLGPWLSEAWLVGCLAWLELGAVGGVCSLGTEGLEAPPGRIDLALLSRCVPWARNAVHFLRALGPGGHCCSVSSAGNFCL